MDSEQLCLFCQGACACNEQMICAADADNIQLGVTTRCTGCCDEPRQCARCAKIDAGEVMVEVDIDTHNVVGIFDRRPVAGTLQDIEDKPYKDEVVEMLEDLLARARQGEFTGMAAVLDGDEGLVTLATLGAVEDPIIYLGGLARVAHNIQRQNDDED
ncbi:hypothetical protein [Sphingomonas sp. ACRSK]|uniref:hypothetical protein n=1 Tax=Sphingomonas sp. ACRSK TaxID=2918213 RepID=UPI001EF5CADD|nr:hypothetical protein [Sphingomonas sp. ACRSK]MCG7349014.1 hypothetical protein [Sphingomonas sp. ACRSK]